MDEQDTKYCDMKNGCMFCDRLLCEGKKEERSNDALVTNGGSMEEITALTKDKLFFVLGFIGNHGNPIPISYIQYLYDKYGDTYNFETNNKCELISENRYWRNGWKDKNGSYKNDFQSWKDENESFKNDFQKVRMNEMIIETAIKPEEDLDLLCNSLNAQAGRFSYSDPALHDYLLRAQAAISSLREMLEDEREFSEELKDMM